MTALKAKPAIRKFKRQRQQLPNLGGEQRYIQEEDIIAYQMENIRKFLFANLSCIWLWTGFTRKLNQNGQGLINRHQMPGIDGFETCNRLKSGPETAHIPVLFMTALANWMTCYAGSVKARLITS